MSFFSGLEMMPDDPILSLPILFNADSREKKVNLGIGAYRTAEGKPMVLSCVRKAEAALLEAKENKEYLPIEGDRSYIEEALKLIFGKESSRLRNEEIFAIQTVGGSGALRIAGEFLAQGISNQHIYLSNPSWPNHKQIFSRAGLKIEHYPYYDLSKHCLDLSGFCKRISEMPPRSILLIQASCHNPTGVDPSFVQWQELSALIQKHSIIPFFDLAYQGFGEGIEQDVKAVRYFVEQGHELLVASSYSKNFGLYSERVGLLSIVTHDKENAKCVGSQVKQIIRGNYSNPPSHGARIVATILQSESLKKEWMEEVKRMRERIQNMRQAFAFGLMTRQKMKDFSFIHKQNGIFSYSGLSSDQVMRLRQEYGIYMPLDGRINVAGLNGNNLNDVIEAILAVLSLP